MCRQNWFHITSLDRIGDLKPVQPNNIWQSQVSGRKNTKGDSESPPASSPAYVYGCMGEGGTVTLCVVTTKRIGLHASAQICVDFSFTPPPPQLSLSLSPPTKCSPMAAFVLAQWTLSGLFFVLPRPKRKNTREGSQLIHFSSPFPLCLHTTQNLVMN